MIFGGRKMKTKINAVGMKKLKAMLSALMLLFVSSSLIFASNKETWRKWNVTYFDFSNPEDHSMVFEVLPNKLDMIRQLKGMQGIRNPLVREVSAVDILYKNALLAWLDYLKLSLCCPDGLENLTDDEIAIYNEIFPYLDVFANDFSEGTYTNGIDPRDFTFAPRELKEYYSGVLECLEQMGRHVKIQHYINNPDEIPQLERGRKVGGNKLPLIIVLTLLIAGAVVLYLKRDILMKNEKIASIVGKIVSLFNKKEIK